MASLIYTLLSNYKRRRILTHWVRFAEGFVTIMVSCAPAMASLWINIVSKSNFYIALRSRFPNPEGNRSPENRSSSYTQERLPPCGSNRNSDPNLRNSQAHYELSDAAYGRLVTDIHSPHKEMPDLERNISNIATNDQISEISSISQLSKVSIQLEEKSEIPPELTVR